MPSLRGTDLEAGLREVKHVLLRTLPGRAIEGIEVNLWRSYQFLLRIFLIVTIVGGVSRENKCFSCGKEGHMARDCTVGDMYVKKSFNLCLDMFYH